LGKSTISKSCSLTRYKRIVSLLYPIHIDQGSSNFLGEDHKTLHNRSRAGILA